MGFNWRWRWWTARNEDVGQFREARGFRDTNWANRVISFDDGDLAIFGGNPRQIFGRFCRWPWPGPRKTLTRCQRHGWKAAARAKIFLTDKSKFSSFFCGESGRQTWGKDTSADGGITFLFGKFNSNSPIELVHCCCIFRNFKRLGNQRFFPTNVLQWNHNLKTYSKHFR